MDDQELKLYRIYVNKKIEESFNIIDEKKYINTLYELQRVMDDYFDNVTNDNKELMDELLIQFLDKIKEENFG